FRGFRTGARSRASRTYPCVEEKMLNRNLAALAMIGVLLVVAGCTPSRSDNRFGGPPEAQGPGPGPSPRELRTASGRVEGRISFIHAELRITRNQEAQFDTFAVAMRADATARDDFRRSFFGQPRRASLPERLDRIQ